MTIMIDGGRIDPISPRVYEKNAFTREDFDAISKLLQDHSLDIRSRKALLSLLRAYCKGLYCDECKGSLRTSSTGGVCKWNQDMPIDLPLNDGPLRSYPANCPIRGMIK